jgi:choline dehydrogenase-like flavoprotein
VKPQRALDVIIVGAGASGCVAARTLVDRGARVQLIEAGASNLEPEFRSANFFATRGVASGWWPNVAVRHTEQQPWIAYRQGRGIGGSGAVNGMIALPGRPSDFAGWADPAWELAQQLALQSTPADPGPLGHSVLDALSHRAVAAPLWGRRVNGILERRLPNLEGVEVSTNQQVQAITQAPLRGSRHTDSRTWQVRTDHDVFVADQVILCAGAIRTPQLLRGIESSTHQDSTTVCAQDHPGVRFAVRFRPHLRAPRPALPAATVMADLGDDVQLLVLDTLTHDTDAETTSHSPVHGVLMVALMTPTSVGHLRFEGEAPHLELGLLSSPQDRQRLRSGVRQVVELLQSGALHDTIEEVFIDDHGTTLQAARSLFESDTELDAWMLRTTGDYSHVTSTCPAGSAIGIGTSLGAVVAHDGLWIADASLFPHVPSANPMLATMAIGELVARQV